MHRPFIRPLMALGLALALLPVTPSARQQGGRASAATVSAAEFFTATRVWKAHLTMTPEAWQAMQPRNTGGGSGFGGGSFLGPPGGRNGVAARQGIEFDYVKASLQLDDWTFTDVAARFKGNGSYLRAVRDGDGKISIKVDLNKYVKGQKLAGLTTLNFQNNITDAGWMNEVLAYRLYRDAGALAPRTTYAQVSLTVGNQPQRYLGLYSISENVDENFAQDRFGTRNGAIFKPSTRDLFTDWGSDWAGYDQSYDPKTDLTDAQKQRVIALGRLVSHAGDEEFAAKIGDFVDLDGFARYFAVLVWIANYDSLLQNGQNFYTYLHPDTNRMHFIAWDQDFSFGNGRSNYAVSVTSPGGNSRFLTRMYKVPAFRDKYLAAMAAFSDRLFLTERFTKQMNEIAPALRPSIQLEGEQWLAGFDAIASGRSGILPFVTRRAASVKAELEQVNGSR
jgi:hypothetical protein